MSAPRTAQNVQPGSGPFFPLMHRTIASSPDTVGTGGLHGPGGAA